MKTNQLIFIVTVLFISACSTANYLNQRNLAHLYQADQTTIHPKIQIFHKNDSITNILLMYHSNKLLHIKNSESSLYEANLTVTYNIYQSMESLRNLGSGSINLVHQSKIDTNEFLSGKLNIHLKKGKYIIELLHTDINRKYTFQTFHLIDKETFLSRQNFMLNDLNNNLIFGNNIPINTNFKLYYSRNNTQKITARYYNRSFAIASPPFSINNPKSFDYKADSIFNFNITDTIIFHNTGFYHFQLDTNTTEGFSVFCFKETFPYVGDIKNMIGPLRYLTSKKEFQNIKKSNTQKNEIDKFWLQNASSPERAKNLVKTYYNRVEEANQFFTSYTEGWQTDRGMIYIVFGPPNTIYKSSDSESWIYGNERNYLSYNFNFMKVQNPFTNNDFMLNRSGIYRYSWGQAVETWRQGKIYSVSDITIKQDERNLQQQMHFWY